MNTVKLITEANDFSASNYIIEQRPFVRRIKIFRGISSPNERTII